MTESTIVKLPKTTDPNIQKISSFPNQNHKNIDYVIVYEKHNKAHDESKKENHKESSNDESKKMKKEKVIKAFFDELKAQKIEVYEIKTNEKDSNEHFCLLHCPTERLLQEAENSRLEIILKNVR